MSIIYLRINVGTNYMEMEAQVYAKRVLKPIIHISFLFSHVKATQD
jgi:hypothetical protein